MASPSPSILAASALACAAACAGAAALTGANPPEPRFMAPEAVTVAAFSAPDAVRLAKQATFGPTPALIAHMSQVGPAAWLDEQFALAESGYQDIIADRNIPQSYCRSKSGSEAASCKATYWQSTPVAMRFYADAVMRNDQLRQRVALALAELLVVANQDIDSTAGLATYHQLLLDNAFGNYRDLLKAVTLNAYMGDYLDMAGSTKASPNENYARELMQLFSIGEDMLNLDGSLKLDVQGAPIPAYTGSDVHEVARALTGWTCVRFPGASPKDKSRIDYTQRMIRSASDYDADAKSFLGVTVPAQASQSASVDAVVDAVFNHPNVAPYVSKSLIQQLVVSNPTPAYVERVARVFADNGQGVRGSMRSVVRAILLDPEARGDRLAAIEGKVKEPVLLAVALARAIGMTTDGYVFTTRDGVMGQPLWSAPSVFNFYPPDYPLPLGAPLVSPPSKLLTTAADVGRHNLVYDWTVEGDADRKEFKPHTQSATGTKPLWADWEAAAADVEGLMDRVNLLLLGNGMSATQRSAMRGALTAIVNKNATTQARQRAQTALYLAASSPLFQVDR